MKTKLLILLKSIDGGTGTYLNGLLNIKNLYKKDELEIKVIVIDYPLYRHVDDKNYTFFNDSASEDHSFRAKSIITIFKHLFWFKKNIDNYEPNIVIASNIYAIFLSEITKYVYRFKYKAVSLVQNNLLQVIEYKSPVIFQRFIKNVFAYLLKKSNLIITVSKYLSIDLYREFSLKNIPITVETLSHNKIINKNKKTIKSNRILTIARLDGQKDHQTLIKAFKLVSAKIPDSELVVVGDGPLRKDIENLTKNLKLENNVKFLGWVQDARNLMSSSSLFVLSSKFEGFPLVLFEAMSHGLPIISSNCKYGPYEIILKNKYGCLFEVGNVNTLADTIVKILSNRSIHEHYSKMSKLRVSMYDEQSMLLKFKYAIDSLSY